MPANASVNRFALDGDTVLRARGLGTVGVDTASGVLNLDTLTSYWDSGVLAENFEIVVVLEIESIALGGGTLNAVVQVDDNVGFSSATALETRAIAATGRYVFTFAREEIVRADSTANRLRLLTDVTGGTTPAWAFNVYVSLPVGA